MTKPTIDTRIVPPPGPRRRFMIGFGLFAAVLLLWLTRFGLGVTPDGVDYVSAARGLLAGKGFLNQWHGIYRHWPPLYPIVLAVLRLVSRDLLDVARIFQVVGYGLLVAMAAGVLWQDLRRRFVAVLGALLVVVCLPVIGMSAKLASEPLYILLSVAVVYLYPRARARDVDRDLLWIAVPAGLAAIQRYVGVAIIAAVCLYLLLEIDSGTLRRRFRRAVRFGAMASAPFFVWIVRNIIAAGTLTGRRPSSHYAFGATLWRGLWVPGSWWLPSWLGEVAAAVLVILLLVLLVVALPPIAARVPKGPRLSPRIRLAGVIALVHIVVMVLAMMNTGLSVLGNRYLAPAAPALVLLIAGLADDLASRPFGRAGHRAATFGMGLVLAIFLATSSVQVAHRFARVSEARAVSPLSGLRWEASPVLGWVRSLQGRDVPLYTNAYRLVVFYGDPVDLTRLDPAKIEKRIARRKPGAYVLLDLGFRGWDPEAVRTIARRHPSLVRVRGPHGVVLTIGGARGE